MFDSEKYYQLGALIKSHGVKGGIVLEVELNISNEEILKMELVFVLIDKLPVPFFIEEIKTHSKNKFILKFEDINDIDSADELCISTVLIEKIFFPDLEKELTLKDLVGYTVITYGEGYAVDNNISLGVITEFIDIELNPMFQIEKDDSEILIPANPNFITDIIEETKTLIVNLPKGLVNLDN